MSVNRRRPPLGQVLIGTLNHSTCTVHFRYVTNKSDRVIAAINVILELCDLCDYFASLLLVAISVVIVSSRKKVPD